MKRINSCFVILLCSVSFLKLHAQQEIPEDSPYSYIYKPCHWNDTIWINSVTGYYAYYTTNDNYDGPVDSSYCITLNADGVDGHISIPYSEIDTAKPLFIEAEIFPYNEYNIYHEPYGVLLDSFESSSEIQFGTDCIYDFCTGAYFSLQIPDSNYIDSVLRWYSVPLESLMPWEYDNNYRIFCFAPDNFENITMKNFILKLNFQSLPDSGNFVSMRPPRITSLYAYNYLSDLTHGPTTLDGDHYNMYLSNLGPYDGKYTFTVPYLSDTYPSPEHKSYLDVSPYPNTDSASVINFYIDESTTLLFEPYAELRGGIPLIDTLIRHTVNLILNGGDFCLDDFMDVANKAKDRFIYKSGGLNFIGTSACMRFQEGGTLEVADDATLNYSKNGIGILALHNDGHIVLDKNATLNIGAKMFLFRTETNPGENVYINLPAGTTLRFTEGCSIWRMNDGAQDMFINIYMNGGILDDSGLSEADKKLIRRIYPDESNALGNKIFAYPNPVSETVTLEIQNETATQAQISLLDLNGKILLQQTANLSSGLTPVYLDVKNINKGFYVVQVTVGDETAGKKIFKL